MKKLTFSSEDRKVFEDMYTAFSFSRKIAQSNDDINNVHAIAEALHAVSVETENLVNNTNMRQLASDIDSVEIILEDTQFRYLQEAVFPPNFPWPNHSVFSLKTLQGLFDKAKEITPRDFVNN